MVFFVDDGIRREVRQRCLIMLLLDILQSFSSQ